MMIVSFDYNTSYDPAIPVVDIEIRATKNEPAVSVSAIVDSGADATIIPVAILR